MKDAPSCWPRAACRPIRIAGASARWIRRIFRNRSGTCSQALVRESAGTWASGGAPVTDWHFFNVAADEELYAPVLQFARNETVFPSAFNALEDLFFIA